MQQAFLRYAGSEKTNEKVQNLPGWFLNPGETPKDFDPSAESEAQEEQEKDKVQAEIHKEIAEEILEYPQGDQPRAVLAQTRVKSCYDQKRRVQDIQIICLF